MARPPRIPLEVDGEQHLLKDVFAIRSLQAVAAQIGSGELTKGWPKCLSEDVRKPRDNRTARPACPKPIAAHGYSYLLP